MKYGYCKNHPKIYAQNSRGLCSECTREKHRQSAESKGFTVKEKSNGSLEGKRKERDFGQSKWVLESGSFRENSEFGEQEIKTENEIEDDIYTRQENPTQPNGQNAGISGRESRKEGKIDFKKAKIKHRSEKGKEIIKQELLLFQKIFNERPPWCEWCKASITVFSPMNYHHLRTKGSHPELRLVESNIVKICSECHLKEHGFKPRKNDMSGDKIH